MTSKQSRTPIGRRLMNARLQRGRTQSDVARKAGIASAYLSRIENGHVQPSFRAVMEVAEALGASLDELAEEPLKGAHRGPCPVTARGRCLLDLIVEEPDAEHYSPREVRLIKRFAAWLKVTSAEGQRAMEVLLDDLTRAASAPRKR